MTPDETKKVRVGSIVRGFTLRVSDPARTYCVTSLSGNLVAGMNMRAKANKHWRYIFNLERMELVQL